MNIAEIGIKNGLNLLRKANPENKAMAVIGVKFGG
jgi:hypothetical protein